MFCQTLVVKIFQEKRLLKWNRWGLDMAKIDAASRRRWQSFVSKFKVLLLKERPLYYPQYRHSLVFGTGHRPYIGGVVLDKVFWNCVFIQAVGNVLSLRSQPPIVVFTLAHSYQSFLCLAHMTQVHRLKIVRVSGMLILLKINKACNCTVFNKLVFLSLVRILTYVYTSFWALYPRQSDFYPVENYWTVI